MPDPQDIIASKRKVASVLAITSITLIALFLRINRLGHYSLWLDETIQYIGSTYSLKQLYQSIFPQEMPLSFLIGKLQNGVGLNKDAFELRLGAAVAGTALVPVIYILSIRLFDLQTAMLSALIVAMLPCFVQYSQEYRMYSYFALLTAVTSLFAVIMLQRPIIMSVCLLSVSSLLSIYTHFLGVISILSIYTFFCAAVFLIYYQDRQLPEFFRRGGAMVAVICTVSGGSILTIPMWARFLSEENIPDKKSLSIFNALQVIFGDYLGIGHEKTFGLFMVLATTGMAAAIIKKPQSVIYLFFCIFLPLVIFYYKGSGRIMQSNRYLIFIYPTYAMAVGYGLSSCSTAAANVWRYFLSSHLVHPITQSAAAVSLFFILIGPLSGLYSHNIKPVPTNLEAAYSALLKKMNREDLLLEGATAQGGSPYYFRFYDSYFLRDHKFIRPEVIDDINLTPWLKTHGDENRRLWILMTVDRQDQDRIYMINDTGFNKECFDLICLFTRKEKKIGTVNDQLENFLYTYATLDERLARLSAERNRNLGPN